VTSSWSLILQLMVPYLHNNVSFARSIIQGGSNMTGTDYMYFTHKSVPVIFEPTCIIYKRIIIKIYDLLVRHVSACIDHLQVTVKRNEILFHRTVSTVKSQKPRYALS